MTNNSPYIPGMTVRDPAMFFGRIDELAQLTDAIRKGRSEAVVGLRRIGKSSLLYHLAHHATVPDNIAIAYLDLLDARYHTILGLISGILQGLQQTTGHRYAWPAAPDIASFTETIRQMKADGYQPVVCLDEMERLMAHPETFDRAFFEAWRALGSMGDLAFVTASRARLSDVVQHNGSTSPFTNIFTQLTLRGLEENAARALLTQPFRAANRPVPPDSHIEYALPVSGRHPFFLQLAGETLWRMGGVNREQFRQQMATAARQPMEQLWRDLSPTEQAAALRLATGKGAVPNWAQEQASLLEIGLAEAMPTGEPRLFSNLLTDWLRQGAFRQTPALRHLPGAAAEPPILQPTPTSARPIYASAFIFLVGLAVIALLAQWLGWGVMVIALLLAIYLAFVLVGDDKITGRDFLDMLDKWLRDLWPNKSGTD